MKTDNKLSQSYKDIIQQLSEGIIELVSDLAGVATHK